MKNRCAETNEPSEDHSREEEWLSSYKTVRRTPSMFSRTALSMAAALMALGTFLSMQAE
ncbi:MAG: hypothetical protein KAG70_14305 [Alcanivorax sp.]|uniref:hypothetical protein n=1 Tax=Fulvimarina manganoxydans TaxID=937218 RepID=UPI002353BC6A|nr:hypothetical protein [Fulvimarina manganoxydans]MCK5887655.1 hypothetical protein [Alcanivorax sp.]MCK5932932.1 hypothetical protein [Fulvimarina manganoxydans]